jgi:hypothetical protein
MSSALQASIVVSSMSEILAELHCASNYCWFSNSDCYAMSYVGVTATAVKQIVEAESCNEVIMFALIKRSIVYLLRMQSLHHISILSESFITLLLQCLQAITSYNC